MTDIEIRSRDDAPVTPEALAQMGGGRVAYMKPLKADEVHKLFPQAPEIPAEHTVYAMMGADGSPMALADDPDAVVASAIQHSIQMVSVH